MNFLTNLLNTILATLWDITPIVLVIGLFQIFVLRRSIANLPRVAWGFAFVILGLSLFLLGLKLALFPLGEAMARQLTALPHAAAAEASRSDESAATVAMAAPLISLPPAPPWYAYYWTYLFAFSIGFSATIAEPALLAVAIKAQEISGGAIQVWGLRCAVAFGAGLGVMLGTLRIVLGIPLPAMVIGGYCLVMLQTCLAPRQIVPLAYDSGGVTTSTVTVPLIAALGLGLATRIPGRSPLTDGFGMIALAVLFPMITVMGYAQIAAWQNSRSRSVKA